MCERQKQKIDDEYYNEIESQGKTKEELRKEAAKREKGAIKALDDRYKKALRKLQTETAVAKERKSYKTVRAEVNKKKDALHAKHLAKFEAREEALRKKRLRIDRKRDDGLGVFRLESIQKSRVEALGNLDDNHDDALKKFDAQKKKSLDNLDRELSAGKEKLEKKKSTALDNIGRQEEDRVSLLVFSSILFSIPSARDLVIVTLPRTDDSRTDTYLPACNYSLLFIYHTRSLMASEQAARFQGFGQRDSKNWRRPVLLIQRFGSV